tara:strand:+ start:236 stop:355 length:120 start_codon:yes stop_codon:yes gene_type:complete
MPVEQRQIVMKEMIRGFSELAQEAGMVIQRSPFSLISLL